MPEPTGFADARPTHFNKGKVVRIFNNVKLSEEARELILKHYWRSGAADLEDMRYLPMFRYVTSVRDGAGNPIASAKLGYRISSSEHFREARIFAFDDGKKFFAIAFSEAFDENAIYLMEYFDDTVFILKE